MKFISAFGLCMALAACTLTPEKASDTKSPVAQAPLVSQKSTRGVASVSGWSCSLAAGIVTSYGPSQLDAYQDALAKCTPRYPKTFCTARTDCHQVNLESCAAGGGLIRGYGQNQNDAYNDAIARCTRRFTHAFCAGKVVCDSDSPSSGGNVNSNANQNHNNEISQNDRSNRDNQNSGTNVNTSEYFSEDPENETKYGNPDSVPNGYTPPVREIDIIAWAPYLGIGNNLELGQKFVAEGYAGRCTFKKNTSGYAIYVDGYRQLGFRAIDALGGLLRVMIKQGSCGRVPQECYHYNRKPAWNFALNTCNKDLVQAALSKGLFGKCYVVKSEDGYQVFDIDSHSKVFTDVHEAGDMLKMMMDQGYCGKGPRDN